MDPKECNANTAGKTGEFHLQAALDYIDDWVNHVPETLPEIQVPKTTPELVDALGGNHQDAIL